MVYFVDEIPVKTISFFLLDILHLCFIYLTYMERKSVKKQKKGEKYRKKVKKAKFK